MAAYLIGPSKTIGEAECEIVRFDEPIVVEITDVQLVKAVEEFNAMKDWPARINKPEAIRGKVRQPRNQPCKCGSGLKAKRCCK